MPRDPRRQPSLPLSLCLANAADNHHYRRRFASRTQTTAIGTLVALPRDPRRQRSRCISLCLAIRGDNDRDACRFASRSEATTIAMHVALPREPIGQRSRSLWLRLAIQGDIHRDACRFTSRSKAISIAILVAQAHDPCRLLSLCAFQWGFAPTNASFSDAIERLASQGDRMSSSNGASARIRARLGDPKRASFDTLSRTSSLSAT